jgi:hypothetical protein
MMIPHFGPKWKVQWSAKPDESTGNEVGNSSTGTTANQAMSYSELEDFNLQDWDLELGDIFPGVMITTVKGNIEDFETESLN